MQFSSDKFKLYYCYVYNWEFLLIMNLNRHQLLKMLASVNIDFSFECKWTFTDSYFLDILEYPIAAYVFFLLTWNYIWPFLIKSFLEQKINFCNNIKKFTRQAVVNSIGSFSYLFAVKYVSTLFDFSCFIQHFFNLENYTCFHINMSKNMHFVLYLFLY